MGFSTQLQILLTQVQGVSIWLPSGLLSSQGFRMASPFLSTPSLLPPYCELFICDP